MITQKDDKTLSIGSNKTYLISIAGDFKIFNDKDQCSVAAAN